MVKREVLIPPSERIGLSRAEAADYIGVSTTLKVNGFDPVSVVRRGGLAVVKGDWADSDIVSMRYTGSTWQLSGFVASDIAQSAPAFGQCILSVASTTSLQLMPLNGNRITIDGKIQIVPSGGVTVNGVKVATDRESQSMINAAYTKAVRDNTFTTQWKATDRTFHTLAATDMIALGDAVLAFVTSCFTAEAFIVAGIAGGTITTKKQIDEDLATLNSSF